MSAWQRWRPVRVAIVNDYELVVVGVAALLAPFRDRIKSSSSTAGCRCCSDVDVVLYDTFGQVQGNAVDLEALVDGGGQGGDLQLEPPARAGGGLARGRCGGLPVQGDGRRGARAPRSSDPRRQTVVPPQRRRDGQPEARSDWPGQEHGLTAREAEIVALITQGLSNQEIADRSYLSINSVKTYIRTAYRKMGVDRRSQAVLWGIKHGFEPDVLRRVQR